MSLALLAIPVMPLVGAWLHELTHAVAAVVLGGRYERIDLRRLHVDFSVPTARRESTPGSSRAAPPRTSSPRTPDS